MSTVRNAAQDYEEWGKSDKMFAAICERCSNVHRTIGEAILELNSPNSPELNRIFSKVLDEAMMHLDANEPYAAAECLHQTYSPYGPVDRVIRGAGLSFSCIENAIRKVQIAREMLLKEIRVNYHQYEAGGLQFGFPKGSAHASSAEVALERGNIARLRESYKAGNNPT